MSDRHSTTMVRVPGSSGDSGFHRESLSEEVKIKTEPGIEASAKERSSRTCEDERSPDHQSFGRGFDDEKIKEEDRLDDLEEKPQLPPEAPSGATADRAAKHDPQDENPRGIPKRFSFVNEEPAEKMKKESRGWKDVHKQAGCQVKTETKSQDVKSADREVKFKGWPLDELSREYHLQELNKLLTDDPVLKKMKPKLIGSLRGPISAPKPTPNVLEALHRLINLLNEAGFTAGSFNAKTLLECNHDRVIAAGQSLFKVLSPLIGIRDPTDTPIAPIVTSDRRIAPRITMDQVLTPINDSPKGEQTGSSRYASAEESDEDSTDSFEIQRMSLGPAGTSLLRKKLEEKETDVRSGKPPGTQFMSTLETDQMHSIFRSAMRQYELEQARAAAGRSANYHPEPETYMPDIDMESVGSRAGGSRDYGPEHREQGTSRLPQVATAGTAEMGGFSNQRIRMSAMAELKEFAGMETNEEKARNWISKVKSAFLRDQAPEAERCLVFCDLLTGPARDWYNQLTRSTKNSWKTLLDSFMAKYGGKNSISVGRLYYHARKRSNETPLQYLYRLNVAAIRAKIPFRDGSAATRKEHVNHYIGTLDDRDLARILTMLRLGDADDLEETLQENENMEVREAHASMGSSKFRQRLTSSATQVPARPARAVRAIHVEDGNDGSEVDSSGSDSDSDRRKMYLAAAMDRAPKTEDSFARGKKMEQEKTYDRGKPKAGCAHCGSKRHDERGCWKKLTCQKCGRKGHPSDKCYYACSVCKDVHDEGKCPMELFYNWIRQWYVPTKHAGMLPEPCEKMLN